MKTEAFESRWGSLTLELNVEDRMALGFTFFFMLRRMLLVIIIVAMPRISWF